MLNPQGDVSEESCQMPGPREDVPGEACQMPDLRNEISHAMSHEKTERCTDCGKCLSQGDIGMTKKLVNRGAKRFRCIACLARYFEVPEEELQRKLEEFRAMGCTLFEQGSSL